MRSSGFWVLAATILGSSLVFLDGAVVSIALPVMQVQLHASSSDAQWVVEGYTLVLGALMLLCGALADRYGRKRVFLSGVIVFALGSLWCGLAGSIPVLLAARVVQGIGGTMLAPASLALLGAHFKGEARGKAVGTWSALTALAATAGPLAGGVIVDHFGWRLVFDINLPLAAFIVVLTLLHVRESRDEDAAGRPLDVAGSALITVALGTIVYAFIQAGNTGWRDPKVLAAALTGPACLAAFVAVELRVRNPIMPLTLFAGRTFAGVNLLTFLLYGALSGAFYYVPFVIIQADGYSATFAGLAMLPFVVLMIALSRTSGALVYRFGSRLLLTVGPAIVACGFALFAVLSGTSYWRTLFPGVLCVGVGMGLTVAPLTTTMMESVAQHRVGLASGINNAISRIAGLLAIAVLGVLLATVFNARLTARLDSARVAPQQRAAINAQRVNLAGAKLADPASRRLVLDAFSDGFRGVAFSCAFLAALGGLSSALLIEKRPKPVDA